MHVGFHLIEAYKTLAMLPDVLGPSGLRSVWPFAIIHNLTAEELAEIEAEMVESEAPTFVTPTARQIAQMEAALSWPGRYLRDEDMRRIVNAVAYFRSRGRGIDAVAYRMKTDFRVVKKLYHEGLDKIAAHLRGARTPVF